MKKLITFLLILFPAQALAWDGQVQGKISYIEVTGGNNYGFRVTLKNGPALCGNSHKWAYVNESDSNYQVYVSTLLAAKHAGTAVRLHTTQTGSQGYCHIGHVFSF